MKSEELIKVLKAAGVEIQNDEEFAELGKDRKFCRVVHFEVPYDKTQYSIVWFTNMMTLSMQGPSLDVMFETIEHSGTWPNRHKRNLQMYQGSDCVAVIGLEEY